MVKHAMNFVGLAIIAIKIPLKKAKVSPGFHARYPALPYTAMTTSTMRLGWPLRFESIAKATSCEKPPPLFSRHFEAKNEGLLQMILLFKQLMFRFHVHFPGCFLGNNLSLSV